MLTKIHASYLIQGIENILELRVVQIVCYFNTLLAVIWHFGGKGIMFRSRFLLGFDGLGLHFFFAMVEFSKNFLFVALNLNKSRDWKS
jgi:hypothetical protein